MGFRILDAECGVVIFGMSLLLKESCFGDDFARLKDRTDPQISELERRVEVLVHHTHDFHKLPTDMKQEPNQSPIADDDISAALGNDLGPVHGHRWDHRCSVGLLHYELTLGRIE